MKRAAAAGGPDAPAVDLVYTHDSIGLGEDGPTHQPIEQLAHPARHSRTSTRCGPADANETALAWQFALSQHRRARPRWCSAARGCRSWTRTRSRPTPIERGAYVLREASEDASRELILIGTGSEVTSASAPRSCSRQRRNRHARGLRALPRPLRRAGRRLSRQRAAPGRARARVGRGRDAAGLGAPGSARMARRSA